MSTVTDKDATQTPYPDLRASTDRNKTDRNKSVPEVSARDRHKVLRAEQDEFGGVKFGLAFFGWLTATGTAVLLTAFVAGAGIGLGVATHSNTRSATSQIEQDPKTIGIIGGVILLVVLFVAYGSGGYVAARMARFHGLRQGLAVWLWGVLIAAVVAVLAALAGSQFDVLSRLNSFPRIPVSQGSLTTGGLIALGVAAAGSLAGALIGGFAGMHFHRKVDRANLGR